MRLWLDLYRLICKSFLVFLLIWGQNLSPWIELVFFICSRCMGWADSQIFWWKYWSILERTRRSCIQCCTTYSIVVIREELGLLVNFGICKFCYFSLINICLLLLHFFIFNHSLNSVRKFKHLFRELARLLCWLYPFLASSHTFPKLFFKSGKWIGMSWILLRGIAARWWWFRQNLIISCYSLLTC